MQKGEEELDRWGKFSQEADKKRTMATSNRTRAQDRDIKVGNINKTQQVKTRLFERKKNILRLGWLQAEGPDICWLGVLVQRGGQGREEEQCMSLLCSKEQIQSMGRPLFMYSLFGGRRRTRRGTISR